MDSNHRPHAYQACALTTWATDRSLLVIPRSFPSWFPNSALPCFRFLYWIGAWVLHSLSHRGLKNHFFAASPRVLDVGTADWWRWWGSNPWPPACRAGALPAELHPHYHGLTFFKDHSWSPKIEQQKLPYACFRSRQSTTVNSWKLTMVSIERRWSSRTFRYGYLVTT